MIDYSIEECILKIDKVGLTLNDNVILKNVQAEVHNIVRPGMSQGQVVGFLGPSGIGKTKLFEIMAGLLRPTEGTVTYGKEVARPGSAGVVQQNYPLFNHRTVYGNLKIAALKNYKSGKESDERIQDMLSRFNLSQYAQRYPAQLSGGQKQRVAIAQQLLCSKHFILMDEPFSGLDINMVDEVSELISEIASSHELNTVIIVSHDIVSTAAISDTIWLMGRDRDANNIPIAGSYIKHTFDLIKRDLAWHPEIRKQAGFNQLINEIRDLFQTL